MYADRTMCELLGVHPSISPEDCYDVWFAGISPNYVAAVLDNVDIVRRDGYSEITYTWNHPACTISSVAPSLSSTAFAASNAAVKDFQLSSV